MADNTIDNLSIGIVASADSAVRMFERLASSAERLRSAASSAADALRDEADAADDAGTETQESGQQSGRAARNFNALWTSIRRAGSVIGGGFVNAVRRAHRSVSGFITGIARIAKFRIYRTIIKDLGQSFKDLYGYSDAFGTKFADSMDKITTALTYLRNSIAAMTAPLINALAPALDLITDKIVGALNWFNEFFAALTGASTFTVAKKVAVSFGDAISSSGKKAKKASDDIKRTILGFDEINKLVAPKDSSGGSSGSSPYSDNYKKMFEERTVSGGLKLFSNALEKSLKDSLSRIGLIVSGASLAVGAILALSGANVPLGLGLMAAGVAGIAMTLSWNGLDGEVYSSLKKIMGLASLASLAIGMILAFTGVNVPLGIGLIAAGAVGVAAQINWGALTGNVYGSLKSINKLISMASMAIGAILLLTGVNPALGLGLVAGGIVGAAANMDWTSTEKDVYNSLKRIIKIVSLGSVAVGAILLFAGVNKGLGIGLIAAGMAGAAASMDWSSMDKDVYNSLKRIIKIASMGALGIGLILALSGVALPLGLGLMAAGAIGLISGVSGNTSLSWETIGNVIEQKLNNIIGLYKDFVAKAKPIFDEFGKKLNGFFGDVKQGFRIAFGLETPDKNQYVIPLVDPDTGKSSSDTSNSASRVKSTASSVKDPLSDFANVAKKKSSEITTYFKNMSTKTSKYTLSLADGLEKGKNNALKVSYEPVGENVVGTLRDGMNNTWYEATGSMTKGMNDLHNIGDNKSFNDVGANITNTLSNGQIQTWPEAKAKFDKSMENLRNSGYTYSYDVIGKYIVDTLKSGIDSDAWQAVKTVSDFAWSMFHKSEEVPWITFGESIPEDIGNGISNNQYSAVQIATDLGWWIYNGFSGISFWDVGYNICMDIYNGIVSNMRWVQNAVSNVISSVGGYVTGKTKLSVSTKSVSRSTANKPSKSTRYNALGGIFANGVWSNIPQYANGTLNAGSLFWAGERGPELVGRAGGRTEVLNKSQLASAMYSAVQAAMAPAAANFAAAASYLQSGSNAFDMETLAEMVRQGVESAMERQGDIQRQQLDTLRQINAKEFSTEISTASINKAQARMNRRAGMTITPVTQ